MAIQINNFGLCAADYLGTGKGQCPVTSFGDLKGIGVINKGTKLNVVSDTFDEATFRSWITTGKLHQLVNSFSFEDTTPENATEESPDGIMQSVRAGKPMYSMIFKNGYDLNKAIHSLKGFQKWDLIFYFDKGVFMASNVSGTEIKGFNAGMFDADSYKTTSGAVTEFAKIKFQLIDSVEFNERGVFFDYDTLGFDALQIEGVINTNIVFNTLPAGSDTTLYLKVYDSNNTAIDYTATFDGVSDYKVLVNNVQVTISAVVINNGVAELTIPALVTTDVIKASLNGVVADVDLKYYKSKVVTITAS